MVCLNTDQGKEGGGLISPIEWRMITDDSLSPLIHFIKKKKGKMINHSC